MLTIILFIIGFVLLIKGADYLVSGATSLAYKYSIPPIVVGLTIVAFGTSMPEFVVNMVASWSGNTDLSIGNILGSNISNIFLILGVSAAIFPLTANSNTIIKEIPFSLLAAFTVFILANDIMFKNGPANIITLGDGLLLLSFFAIFMYYIFGIAKEEKQDSNVGKETATQNSNFKNAGLILGGLILLIVGGKWIVDGAVFIATYFGMAEKVIGLTVVAIGTSLPELATSVVAAMKKQSDIAIGNIIGSNIFNIFWILGASALVAPMSFDSSANADIFMVMLASVILFATMYVGKRHVIERWQGVLMVLIYISYLIYLLA
jgi:cation:H+ antiporter